jgi:hypothetical protein
VLLPIHDESNLCFGLRRAPIIHVIKNNRPRYVVMSEEHYARIVQRPDLWELVDRPARGNRSKKEVDAQLRAERDRWGLAR